MLEPQAVNPINIEDIIKAHIIDLFTKNNLLSKKYTYIVTFFFDKINIIFKNIFEIVWFLRIMP